MQTYKYVAKKEISGKSIEAVVYANTAQEALKKINELGYTPESIEKLNMLDRRVYARFNLELPVRYNRFKPGHESNFTETGKTKNISVGGILLKTNKCFVVGVIFEILMELSEDDEDIQCLARIICCEAVEESNCYNIALSFLDLPHPERNRLGEFLHKAGQ